MCSHEHHEVTSEPFDATLQSCCERDREQQRRIEEYKETLLQDDPTQVRQNIRRDAVVRDIERLHLTSEHFDSGSDDEDDILGMQGTLFVSLSVNDPGNIVSFPLCRTFSATANTGAQTISFSEREYFSRSAGRYAHGTL